MRYYINYNQADPDDTKNGVEDPKPTVTVEEGHNQQQTGDLPQTTNDN